jgi:hypothetical protein
MSSAGRTPHLERAACRGENWMADLNDKSRPDDLARAEAVCHRCVARLACVAWVDELVPHLRPAGYAAGRLLGLPPAPPRLKPEPSEDARWLAAYLGARRGRVPVAQAVSAAAGAGIADNRIRAAKRHIGVQVNTSNGATFWLLPAEAAVAS